MALETELKLEFDPVDRRRLRSAVQFGSAERTTRRLVSTYFDTAERDLARAGYSLRVRRHGRQHVQTIKATGPAAVGLFARPEWECVLPSEAPRIDDADSPLHYALGAEVLARIVPMFVVEVRRTALRIDAAGAKVEVAIDEGVVRVGERAEAFCELELELGEGSAQALFDLARDLDDHVPLRLAVRSKAQRGYALLDGAATEGVRADAIALDPDCTAGGAFRVVAQACIRQFRLNEAQLLRGGGAEAVHQARVGLRRLRSAFSLFGPLLADDPRTQLLKAELRWLAYELGEVRNLDVLIARCGGGTRALLAAARARAFARVHAELAGARTRLLMIDLVEWLTAGAWCTQPAHPGRLNRTVAGAASEILLAWRDRLAHDAAKFCELDRAHRHRMRIEAKKLRYASEFFAALYPGDKARRRHGDFTKALGALQDGLGELNDLAVGPQVLATLGIDAKLPKSGKHRRRRLLERTDKACREFLDARRFW